MGRQSALARVVAAVHQRWGTGSLTYLDRAREAPPPASGVDAPPGQGPGHPRAIGPDGLPPWWPGATSRDGRPLPVASVLEVGAATGAGRLTFMLAWAAALQPGLVALVDVPVDDGARLYPPTVAAAGLPPACRAVVVRPPVGTVRETTRAVVDSLFILLRSEAFDAILCPFPAGARLTAATATTLATMAARGGTALVAVTRIAGPGPGVRGRVASPLLGPSASWRLVLAGHEWAWRDGELAGLSLEVQTWRARGAAEANLAPGGAAGPLPTGALGTHVLDFHLRRTVRDGPASPGAAATAWELCGVTRGVLGARGGDAAATRLVSAVRSAG